VCIIIEGEQKAHNIYSIYIIQRVPFSLHVCTCVCAYMRVHCATGRRRRPSLFRSVTITRRGRGRWGQKRETTACVGEIYRERKGGRRSKLIYIAEHMCVCMLTMVDRRDSWENNIMANRAARVKKGCVCVVLGILCLLLIVYYKRRRRRILCAEKKYP